MKIEDLINRFQKWAKERIVQLRLDNKEKGYAFHAHEIQYDKELKLEEYQAFFNRDEQNQKYQERFKNEDIPSKEVHAWLQTEVNMIYSYHKCFAMRHRTRLEYYRCDLSQKGARTRSAINIAMGNFMHLRELHDKSE